MRYATKNGYCMQVASAGSLGRHIMVGLKEKLLD
jgi:hypothetical protein